MKEDNGKKVVIDGDVTEWEDVSILSKVHIWIFGFPFDARLYIILAIIGLLAGAITNK